MTGVKIGGHLVKADRFAVDPAMVAISNINLRRIMYALKKKTITLDYYYY